MKTKFLFASLGLICAATVAQAAGVDRSGQSVAVIFEPGNYFEATFGSVSAAVSGVSRLPGQGASGDVSPSFTQVGAAYKHSISDTLDIALIFDQPFGAEVAYPALQPYFAAGTQAELSANALTAVLRYRFGNDVSVLGGLRYQTFSAQATVPFVTAPPGPAVIAPGAPYMANSETDDGVGYVLGLAYERPDIALRIALTYNSEIKHSLPTTETSAFGGPVNSSTAADTPQSVNLEFQTGIAPDTLLFGSARWVDWSAFEIGPAIYQSITGEALVYYPEDMISYSLGIGRQVSENWAIAATVGYEDQMGGFSSNLGPANGYATYGLGATYTRDRLTVTGGVTYADIGNAQTTLGGGIAASDFNDNDAWAFGLKVGYTF